MKKEKMFLPSVSISFALGFLFLIYAPMDIYFNNPLDFQYDIIILLKYLIPIFALSLILLLAVLMLIKKKSEKASRVLLCIMVGVYISLFFQGFLLANKLPILDGSQIIWSEFDYQKKYSVLAWTVPIVVLLFLSNIRIIEIDKIASCLGIFGSIYLALILIISGVSNNGFERKTNFACSDKYMFDMSSDDNFIIFLIDSFDAELFDGLLEDNEEYSEILEDFTFYRNVVSGYSNTIASIPLILTGEWYENDGPFYEFCSEAFLDSPFLNELLKQDYRMGFYDHYYTLAESVPTIFENFSESKKMQYPLQFIKMQIKIAGLKFLPYDLKKLCILTPENIAYDTALAINNGDKYSLESNQFVYNEIIENDVTVNSEKCFRYLYAFGAHEPWCIDENINYIENGTYELSVAGCMTMINAYLTKLKDSNVYDNSVIIILSDHGCNNLRRFGRQNPVLLIKGKNEKHVFSVSDIPVSQEDYQDAFLKLIAGGKGNNIFNQYANAQRERRHIRVNIANFEEYIQYGWAADDDTLLPTGAIFQTNEELLNIFGIAD